MNRGRSHAGGSLLAIVLAAATVVLIVIGTIWPGPSVVMPRSFAPPGEQLRSG